MSKKYSPKLLAAMGFMVLQFLFKITFELEGARKVTQLPVVSVVYVFLPIWVAAMILTVLKQKRGYILGLICGGLNLIAALFMIVTHNYPAGNSVLKPINVAATSLFITYSYLLILKGVSFHSPAQIEPAPPSAAI